MNKRATLLAAILLSTGTMLPVSAADGEVSTMAKNAAWFPVKVVGVGTALVIGTPIAITRRVSVRIREYTATGADKIGGKDSGPPNVFASIWSIPAGTIVGVGEGVYFGGKNAIAHGVEKPFSTASFSLDELE